MPNPNPLTAINYQRTLENLQETRDFFSDLEKKMATPQESADILYERAEMSEHIRSVFFGATAILQTVGKEGLQEMIDNDIHAIFHGKTPQGVGFDSGEYALRKLTEQKGLEFSREDYHHFAIACHLAAEVIKYKLLAQRK